MLLPCSRVTTGPPHPPVAVEMITQLTRVSSVHQCELFVVCGKYTNFFYRAEWRVLKNTVYSHRGLLTTDDVTNLFVSQFCLQTSVFTVQTTWNATEVPQANNSDPCTINHGNAAAHCAAVVNMFMNGLIQLTPTSSQSKWRRDRARGSKRCSAFRMRDEREDKEL